MRRLRHEPQTITREDSVLTAQRRDVRNGRERDQVEHVVDEVRVRAELLGKREHQLERDADCGEVSIGILRRRALRIQHGEALGQRPAGQMVVGDDDVNSGLAQCADGLERTRATVTRDDQSRSSFACGANAGVAQVVPILETARNERHGPRRSNAASG